MTEIDEPSAVKTKAPKARRNLVGIITGSALALADSVTAVSLSVADCNAETERLCTVAVKDGAGETEDAKSGTATADQTLADVPSATLPGGNPGNIAPVRLS